MGVVADKSGGVLSAVVVNPSKVVDLDKRRRIICDTLAEAGWPEPLWLETTPDDPGFGPARTAVSSGAEVVFVCGGDGTVMECVAALTGTEVALAVLPAGTGNLLAANLDLPNDPAAGVRVATGMGRRRIDVGRVDERSFAVMAGMGFDAKMLGGASEQLKARIGWPAYVFSALGHLFEHPMRVAIKIDDQPPMRRRARTVVVGNVGRLQAGLHLLTAAVPDDGVLDVAILNPRTVGHWLSMAWAVARRHPRVPRMETFQAKRVEIRSDRAQPRELDGNVIEPGRRLVVTIEPGALVMCVPA